MKFLAVVCFTLAFAMDSTSENVVSYEGHKTYRISFTTETQFQILYELRVHNDPRTGVMFLQLSRAQQWADVMLSPEAEGPFLTKLDSEGFTYEFISTYKTE